MISELNKRLLVYSVHAAREEGVEVGFACPLNMATNLLVAGPNDVAHYGDQHHKDAGRESLWRRSRDSVVDRILVRGQVSSKWQTTGSCVRASIHQQSAMTPPAERQTRRNLPVQVALVAVYYSLC